jgi:hypothetical protein
VPFLILSSHGFIDSFTVQSGRPLQLESTYSSLLLLGNSMGILKAYVVQGTISLDVSSALAGPLARYYILVLAAALMGAYYLYYRCVRSREAANEPRDMAQLLNYSFLAILVFIVASKVFSPQYLVWLYPLFPLVSGRFRSALWAIFLLAACLTWYIYPLHYWDLVDTRQVPVDTLILRNGLLVFLAVLLAGETPEIAPAAPSALDPATASV